MDHNFQYQKIPSNEHELDRAIEIAIVDLCQYLSDYRDDLWQAEVAHGNPDNAALLTQTYRNSCMIISTFARELTTFSDAINNGEDQHDALRRLASGLNTEIEHRLSLIIKSSKCNLKWDRLSSNDNNPY
jgi:hypothetical protein